MINVIATLLMVAVLVYGITKKWNTVVLIWSISIVALGIWTIVTGQSVLDDASCGNNFLDLFELIISKAKTAFSSNILNVVFIMGYVGLMNHIKASTMFALLVSAPLKKIKKPYLIACLCIALGAVLKLVIPNGISLASLFIATMYPVLMALGVSRATAASAFILGTCMIWGPSENSNYVSFQLANVTETTVPEYFITTQLPIVACTLVAMMIGFAISSKYFDKKENAGSDEVFGDAQTPDSLGVPKYYAIFPLLPLVVILVFSALIVKTIIVSVAGAHLICFFLVMIVVMIQNKSMKAGFDGAAEYFKAAGSALTGVGFLIVAATTFSAAMSKVGGLSILAKLLGQGSPAVFTIGITILAFITIAFVGVVTGNYTIYAPLIGEYCAISGLSALPLINIMLMGTGCGYALAPASSAMMVVSPACKTEIWTIVKRNVAPAICGAIGAIIGTLLIF